MQITKHFSYNELKCPCCDEMEIDGQFIYALEKIRVSVDRPFKLNSAYRCRDHNLAIGGTLSSRHLIGMAVDISMRGWSPADMHYLLFELTSYVPDDKQRPYNTGIGIYKNHIHFDLREDQESLWIRL